jgi:phytoene synthase
MKDRLNPAKNAIRQGSRSFALASLFLPKEHRHNAYLLYHWCRTCDDLIDGAPTPGDALLSLEQIGNPSPEITALKPPAWVNPREREEFLAGFRMDVEGCRYQSFSDLELYCFRVAGVVGLMMCPVLGAGPGASPFAATLGMAMQLTNIARDIQEDARAGRVYLPESLIGDISPESIAKSPEIVHDAVKKILKTADLWYQTGLQGVALLPIRTSFAIALAGVVYRKIGHKLLKSAQKDAEKSFRRRTVVSNFGKSLSLFTALWIVLRFRFLKPRRRGPFSFPSILPAKIDSSPAHAPL